MFVRRLVIVVILAIAFIIAGCNLFGRRNADDSIGSGEGVFNMEKAINMDKYIRLSDLSDSLEMVPLETNDSSLLDRGAYLYYADEKDLFIRSKDYLYHFNAAGHFVNRIGRIGNGPGEYSLLQSVSVDCERRCLLFYVGQGRMQVWDYAGNFHEEIKLQCEGRNTAVALVGKDKLVAESRLYSDSGLVTSICLFDKDGSLLRRNVMQEDKQQVELGMHTVPLFYRFGNVVKYKDANGGWLYLLSEDTIRKQCLFDFGRYTPSRELLEDVRQKSTLQRDFAQLVDIGESSSLFFMTVVYDNGIRGIILNKNTGMLVYSMSMRNPMRGGGLENDLLRYGYFWPSYIDGSDVMYSLFPVDNLDKINGKYRKVLLQNTKQEGNEPNSMVLKVYKNRLHAQ